jgi:hypothetical protein
VILAPTLVTRRGKRCIRLHPVQNVRILEHYLILPIRLHRVCLNTGTPLPFLNQMVESVSAASNATSEAARCRHPSVEAWVQHRGSPMLICGEQGTLKHVVLSVIRRSPASHIIYPSTYLW